MRKYQDPDIVTALEISSYGFCPEAWRLASGLGLRPNNERLLACGERIHENSAAAEWRPQSALRLGFVLLAVGLVVLGFYLLVVRR